MKKMDGLKRFINDQKGHLAETLIGGLAIGCLGIVISEAYDKGKANGKVIKEKEFLEKYPELNEIIYHRDTADYRMTYKGYLSDKTLKVSDMSTIFDKYDECIGCKTDKDSIIKGVIVYYDEPN